LNGGVVGFALPIFRHPTDPLQLSVQDVDELSGRISGFRALEHSNLQLLQAPPAFAAIGEEPLYVFIAYPSAVHAGTLETLKQVLQQFAQANPSRHSIVVQIKELIGTTQEKKNARSNMRKLLLKEQGAAAARSYYEGSVLRSILWERILDVRGQLSATVGSDGKIALQLSALSNEDRDALDTAKLVAAILAEFEPSPDEVGDLQSFAQNHDIDIHERTENLVRQIKNTGRQEERIALLISAILDDPSLGRSVLTTYQKDRAQTAAWALSELRRLFIDQNWKSNEQVIASMLPQLFKQQWPMTRGDLLVSLARHLGRWPQINEAIYNLFKRSQSYYVAMWSEEIKNALARSENDGATSSSLQKSLSDAR
jgi:hypothetical protein